MKARSFPHRTAAASFVWALSAALLLAGPLVPTGNANAQVVVTDPALTSVNSSNFASTIAKQVEQYAKQVQQYALQIEQYQQMLFSAINLGNNLTLTPTTMRPINDPSALVSAKCGSGSSGGVAGSLMSSITSLVHQPLSESQAAICAAIVQLDVDKYNKTVQALGQVEALNAKLGGLIQTINSVKTMADTNMSTAAVSGYSSQLITANTHWQDAMKADDAAISALQSQQSLLANMALNGGGASRILGDALGNATFQAAISALP